MCFHAQTSVKLGLTCKCCSMLPSKDLHQFTGTYTNTMISLYWLVQINFSFFLILLMIHYHSSAFFSSQNWWRTQDLQSEAVCLQRPGDLYLQRLALRWREGLSRWLRWIARYLWVCPYKTQQGCVLSSHVFFPSLNYQFYLVTTIFTTLMSLMFPHMVTIQFFAEDTINHVL